MVGNIPWKFHSIWFTNKKVGILGWDFWSFWTNLQFIGEAPVLTLETWNQVDSSPMAKAYHNLHSEQNRCQMTRPIFQWSFSNFGQNFAGPRELEFLTKWPQTKFQLVLNMSSITSELTRENYLINPPYYLYLTMYLFFNKPTSFKGFITQGLRKYIGTVVLHKR